MAKVRELTLVEEDYVKNNRDKTDAQLSSVMPGIGPKSIAKFRKALPEVEVDADEVLAERDETPHERVERLGNTGPTAGKMMARQDGIVMMTEGASEMSDARNVVKGIPLTKAQFAKNNRSRIHTIDPNKKSR